MARYVNDALDIGTEIEDCSVELLDTEQGREWMIGWFLIEEKYEGVRTFLNSIPKNESFSTDWDVIFSAERYTSLANLLLGPAGQNLFQKMSFQAKLLIMESNSIQPDASSSNVSNNQSVFQVLAAKLILSDVNIYWLLFSCLMTCGDASRVKPLFDRHLHSLLPSNFMVQATSAAIVTRFLNLYENGDRQELADLFEMFIHRIRTIFYWRVRNNADELPHFLINVKEVFLFFGHSQTFGDTSLHLEMFPKFVQAMIAMEMNVKANCASELSMNSPLLSFLNVFEKSWDCPQFRKMLINHLKTYLSIERKKNNNDWSWQKIFLEKFDSRGILSEMSRWILNQVPILFQQIFLDPVGVGSCFWTPNRHGLTRLHQAAFNDDIQYVKHLHDGLVSDFTTKNTPPDVNPIEKYIEIMTQSDCRRLSPFYIAVIRNRQETSLEMSRFLKKLVDIDALDQHQLDDLCNTNGCLYRAYSDLKKQSATSLILVEMCAKEMSTSQNLALHYSTEQFLKKIGNSQSLQSDHLKVNSHFGLMLKQHIQKDSSVINGFHTFWKSTKFMKDSNRQYYADFIDFILATGQENRGKSLWMQYVDDACVFENQNGNAIVLFLHWVRLKLGPEVVQLLVIGDHQQPKTRIVDQAISNGNIFILIALISAFDEEQQLKISDQILTQHTVNGIGNRIAAQKSKKTVTQSIYQHMNGWSDVEKVINQQPQSPVVRLYVLNSFLSKCVNMEENVKKESSYFHRTLSTRATRLWKSVWTNVTGDWQAVLGGEERFVVEFQHFLDYLHNTESPDMVLNRTDCSDLIAAVTGSPLSETKKAQLIDLLMKLVPRLPIAMPVTTAICSNQSFF